MNLDFLLNSSLGEQRRGKSVSTDAVGPPAFLLLPCMSRFGMHGAAGILQVVQISAFDHLTVNSMRLNTQQQIIPALSANPLPVLWYIICARCPLVQSKRDQSSVCTLSISYLQLQQQRFVCEELEQQARHRAMEPSLFQHG